MKIVRALLAAGFFAIVGILFWYLNLSPIVIVTNTTTVSVKVQIETDVGESYSLGTIAGGSSVRIAISGRDKLLWVVANFTDGQIRQSEKIYTTSKGSIAAFVTKEEIEIKYEL
jgi:hypothetical protein